MTEQAAPVTSEHRNGDAHAAPKGNATPLPQDDPGAALTFDLSRPGRIGCTLPPLDVPEAALPPA